MRCLHALTLMFALMFVCTASANTQHSIALLTFIVGQNGDDSTVVQRAEFEQKLSRLDERINSLSSRLDAVQENATNNTARIGLLKDDLEQLRTAVDDTLRQQGEILEAISHKDDESQYLPRLAGNMQNPSFAAEMRDVVNQSIPQRGKLRIVNRTQLDQQIWVNERERFVIPAGRERMIDVSAGTVTTRLPGQRLMTWTVGPPRNQQIVEIIQQQTARPVVNSNTVWRTEVYVPRVEYVAPEVVYWSW